MGRPSKLTEAQWNEIKRRLLDGESGRVLAKEFGVSETAIRKKISSQVSEIKTVANQLASAQTALSKLPISSQISAQTLAQRLLSIGNHLAAAGENGAMVSHRLMGIARMKVEEIDDAAPLTDDSLKALKGIAALTALANESSKIPLNLLAANKEAFRQDDEPPGLNDPNPDV
jgi:biotin operon repressor